MFIIRFMTMDNDVIKKMLYRGVEEIIDKNHLEEALASGKKLRVKLGIDPTAPELHLGHAVLLRKLRQFQDAGHKVILIIGDFTAQIGDPSGRENSRQPLASDQIRKNMRTYLRQVGRIVDLKKAEIQHNSHWLKKLKLAEILELLSKFTVPQLTARKDFIERMKKGLEVGGHEQLYPVMQAYDSVAVKADLEIGAYDQRLNLLAGRHLMGRLGMKPQDILMTPLIEGTDGAKKMSKSAGNFVALEEEPREMFGKIMSIPDKLMPKYFELLTDIDPVPLKMIKKEPRNSKLLLAKTIVAGLHDQEAAVRAMADFVRVFSKKELPEDVSYLSFRATPRSTRGSRGISLVDLLLKTGIKSRGEARRLIQQGGVKINGQTKTDNREIVEIKDGLELRVGKRKFFRIK